MTPPDFSTTSLLPLSCIITAGNASAMRYPASSRAWTSTRSRLSARDRSIQSLCARISSGGSTRRPYTPNACKMGATLVAPATGVAWDGWPDMARPAPHYGASPVAFRRRGATLCGLSYILQLIENTGRRAHPASGHGFCLCLGKWRRESPGSTCMAAYPWRASSTGAYTSVIRQVCHATKAGPQRNDRELLSWQFVLRTPSITQRFSSLSTLTQTLTQTLTRA